jgi:hypothetical protein
MTTNNKWEEEFDKLVPQTTDELLDGDIEETEPTQFGYKIVDNTHKIVHIHTITDWQGIKNFISKIEQDAYNRGKEETLDKVKEVIGKLKLNYDRDYYPSIFEDVEGVREQILQELNNI